MLSLHVFVVLQAQHYIHDLNRPFIKANRASTAEFVEASQYFRGGDFNL